MQKHRSASGGRLPRLVVEVEIESRFPRLTLLTESREDELALRRWLRDRPTALDVFADLAGLLDELDRVDRDAA